MKWSELAERGFRDMLVVAIRDCAKLYFLKDEPEAQIILRTDASDYGYGTYLCQVVGEREYPILFMSKSFHGAELNWKTQDNECGAIYIKRWRSFSIGAETSEQETGLLVRMCDSNLIPFLFETSLLRDESKVTAMLKLLPEYADTNSVFVTEYQGSVCLLNI